MDCHLNLFSISLLTPAPSQIGSTMFENVPAGRLSVYTVRVSGVIYKSHVHVLSCRSMDHFFSLSVTMLVLHLVFVLFVDCILLYSKCHQWSVSRCFKLLSGCSWNWCSRKNGPIVRDLVPWEMLCRVHCLDTSSPYSTLSSSSETRWSWTCWNTVFIWYEGCIFMLTTTIPAPLPGFFCFPLAGPRLLSGLFAEHYLSLWKLIDVRSIFNVVIFIWATIININGQAS